MDAHTRLMVRERAGHRCEYCRLRQRHESSRPFHIEHIIAKQHGGSDEFENLALACHLCNWLKGPNLSSLDPDSSELTRLYHPRKDTWTDHFRIEGALVKGLTAMGRTTVWLLDVNCDERVELRSVLIESGDFD